ncbi:Cobalamin (vitamin B12) biosynthesis CobS, cobalamin-5-phosphate synthase [Candidatus Magnetobacterium bavaricum]|uniref:Adenosylcobinamide-GDP ribazoletransferase n=1 Tax=Candidatus Magnetobacterium bavaricum TaxID=29290 RepID=A0A0F3H0G0_9BACT|nr:Cobalamin (vitamin B12) biosynthesis CobS, cobalamin-5-phosphate synthase [Candidatus Magnetobacterium bavaricum]
MFVFAVRFLTILPVPGRFEVLGDRCVARSAASFPLVGLLIGGCLWAGWGLSTRYLSTEVSCLLSVLLLTVITGGLHLDAIADTFDAIAARKTIAERLNIMKTPTVGPFGVAAIVFCIMLRYLLLKTPLAINASALVLCPVVGRSCCVYAMYAGKSSMKDGLGRLFIENTTPLIFLLSLLSAIAIMAAFDIRYPIILPVCYVFTHLCVMLFQKLLGGLNGDTLGALIELNELLFLLILNV